MFQIFSISELTQVPSCLCSAQRLKTHILDTDKNVGHFSDPIRSWIPSTLRPIQAADTVLVKTVAQLYVLPLRFHNYKRFKAALYRDHTEST